MAPQHKSSSYKPIPVGNPFQEGQDRAYADLLQGALKDKNFWRNFVGIGVLAALALFLALFAYSVTRQEKIPVLINVMPSGETQYLGEVRQAGGLQVPEAAIHYYIRKFVANLRSISTDYNVVFKNIEECFFYVTRSYSPILSASLRNSSPFDLVGKARRTIEIESLLNVTSASYQVDWHETTIDSGTKRVKMRAIVTIRLLSPTPETIKNNPLGIYIENFEMTEL